MCISTVMIVQKLPYVPHFSYTAVAFELPAQHFYPPVATALGIVPFGFKWGGFFEVVLGCIDEKIVVKSQI